MSPKNTSTKTDASTVERVREAKRQALCRQRRRSGLIVLRVEAPEFELIAALIEAERLSEAAALSRAQVERAAAEVLAEWAELWKKKCHP